jgi:hypothetical protein
MTKIKKSLVLDSSVIILALLLVFAGTAWGATKSLTFKWEQTAEDLPENGGDLDHWELYSSADETLPFDQWNKEGDIAYSGPPAADYQAEFTVEVPDNSETNLYFKMVAVDSAGNVSAPSENAIPAPLLIDFKAPEAPVVAGTYDNKTKIVSLTWTQDAGDTDIAKYIVYVADTSGGTFVNAGESTTLNFDYQVPSGYSGKWTYFQVEAVDNAGNVSPKSMELAVKLAMGVPFNLEVQIKVTP